MTYAAREIDVTIQLGKGAFGNSGFNTVKLVGLRVQATVTKAGGLSMNAADVRVYGAPLDVMNQVATLGQPFGGQRNNRITLEAGSAGGVKSVVYVGTIQEAWTDFGAQPQVALHLTSTALGFDMLAPAPPTSYPTQADVAQVMADLAERGGYSFLNDGVQGVTLSPCYFPGTIPDQIRTCAQHAGINYIFDEAGVGLHKLIIWPGGKGRTGALPLISPANGMIGYPTFDSQGIAVRTEFNPTIRYGAQVQVQSDITPACGPWFVIALAHELESQMPGGAWFSQIFAAKNADAIHV